MARRRGVGAKVDAKVSAGRSSGMGSFTGDLKRFADKTGSTLDEAHRGVVIELFSSVINDTPVDEGRAAGNWQTNVGQAPSGVLDRLSPEGSISQVVSNAGKAGEIVYMANNLPYIERLEYGWSAQRPQGMVRTNFARVQQIVRSVVNKVKRR